MIKTVKKAPHEKESPVASKFLIGVLEGVYSQVLIRTQADKEAVSGHIAAAKENLVKEKVRLAEIVKTLEKLKSEVPNTKKKAAEEAAHMLKDFSSNMFFESFDEIDRDYLVVNTKLLFANIRIANKSRENRRACLGAFKIFFPLRDIYQDRNSIRIENRTFGYREHWAMSSGRVCWGEWFKEIDSAIRRRNYYEQFEIILALIRAPEHDSAAYETAHGWRDNRQVYKLCAASITKTTPGEYVMFLGSFEGASLAGMVGVCKQTGGDMNSYVVKPDGKIFTSDFTWNMPHHLVMKIPRSMHDNQVRYDIKNVLLPRDQILKSMDELPNGSVQEDALAQANKKEIKLDLKSLMVKATDDVSDMTVGTATAI